MYGAGYNLRLILARLRAPFPALIAVQAVLGDDIAGVSLNETDDRFRLAT